MSRQTSGHGVSGRFAVGLGDFRMELEFEVDAGRILVLFGPSGAGKTTALRTIAGLVRPDAGRIEIAGRTVYEDGNGAGGRPVWVEPHRRGAGLRHAAEPPVSPPDRAPEHRLRPAGPAGRVGPTTGGRSGGAAAAGRAGRPAGMATVRRAAATGGAGPGAGSPARPAAAGRTLRRAGHGVATGVRFGVARNGSPVRRAGDPGDAQPRRGPGPGRRGADHRRRR